MLVNYHFDPGLTLQCMPSPGVSNIWLSSASTTRNLSSIPYVGVRRSTYNSNITVFFFPLFLFLCLIIYHGNILSYIHLLVLTTSLHVKYSLLQQCLRVSMKKKEQGVLWLQSSSPKWKWRCENMRQEEEDEEEEDMLSYIERNNSSPTSKSK